MGRPEKPLSHGTEYAYKAKGCRCETCRDAMRRRNRMRRERIAMGEEAPTRVEVGEGHTRDVLVRRVLNAAAIALGMTLGHMLTPRADRRRTAIRRGAALALATLPGWSLGAACRAVRISRDGVRMEHHDLSRIRERELALAAAMQEAAAIAREVASVPGFGRAEVCAMLRAEAEGLHITFDEALHSLTPLAVTVRRRVIVRLHKMGHKRVQIAKWLGMTRENISRIVCGHWGVERPRRDGRVNNRRHLPAKTGDGPAPQPGAC